MLTVPFQTDSDHSMQHEGKSSVKAGWPKLCRLHYRKTKASRASTTWAWWTATTSRSPCRRSQHIASVGSEDARRASTAYARKNSRCWTTAAPPWSHARARVWPSIWMCSAAGIRTGSRRHVSPACTPPCSRMLVRATSAMLMTHHRHWWIATPESMPSPSAPRDGVVFYPSKRNLSAHECDMFRLSSDTSVLVSYIYIYICSDLLT